MVHPLCWRPFRSTARATADGVRRPPCVRCLDYGPTGKPRSPLACSREGVSIGLAAAGGESKQLAAVRLASLSLTFAAIPNLNRPFVAVFRVESKSTKEGLPCGNMKDGCPFMFRQLGGPHGQYN